MVQAKHKKSAAARKKQSDGKSHGKKGDMLQFRSLLDGLGLKVIEVTSDGNCFFRALADQIEGDESAHQKYRDMVVKYIKMHREDFEPFIEDEVPFDEYCKSMGEDGTWAGNMELQAASLVTRSNICIHHSMLPRWYIRNFHAHGSRMVHISYHDGEHYNSVRLKDDPCNGPANPIIIKVDAVVSLTAHQEKNKNDKSKGGTQENTTYRNSIKLVMIGSGCRKLSKVEEVLEEVGGDVDAAIEYLIAEKEMEDNVRSDENVKGNDANGGHGQSPEHSQENSLHDAKIARDDISLFESRNEGIEASPTSERKCSERPATRPSKSKKPSAGRKEKEKGKKMGKKKKGGECKKSLQESAALTDLGALCI